MDQDSLRILLREAVREMVTEVPQTLLELDRTVFLQAHGGRRNGYYPRKLETTFGQVDLKVQGYESHLYAAFPLGKHLEGLLCESFLWSSSGGTADAMSLGYRTWRKVVETVRSMLHALFPRRIHAVTQEGFVFKVLSFVLAHNLSLVAQKTLG